MKCWAVFPGLNITRIVGVKYNALFDYENCVQNQKAEITESGPLSYLH